MPLKRLSSIITSIDSATNNRERRVSARVTLRDVAAASGVSEAAASISLRGLPGVSTSTRRRVVDEANRLGYTRNLAASTLAANKSGIVGVIVGDLHNPYFADLADAVSASAEANGLRVLLGTGYYEAQRELDALETFRDLQADGVILVGACIDADTIEPIDATMPIVAVGCLPAATGLDRVVVNDCVGARLATEHLISRGHTDIAHIFGGDVAGGTERLAGFTSAMRNAGLCHTNVTKGGFTAEAGTKAVVELMTRRPSAVVACSDLVAWGAIAEFARHGVSVPDDVSVVGYDNSTTAAPVGDFLTTIDGNRPELGTRAVQLLVERLAGRATRELVVIEPKLIVRHSTDEFQRPQKPGSP